MEQHEDQIQQIIVHDQVNIIDNIETLIKVIRGQQVILDRDLARLYQVETSQLNRQVKRNIERFPEDFMFQLTKEEFENLKCQNGTSSWGGDRRSLPHAFTEQGVSMLSGLLKSKVAINANIRIMRALVSMRHFLSVNADIFHRLSTMEYHQLEILQHQQETDKRIDEVFRRLDEAAQSRNKGCFITDRFMTPMLSWQT